MEPKPKMDLGSECSILEVVEDNGEISNDSVTQKLVNTSEPKVQNVGSCIAKNNDYNDVTECAKYSNSLPVDSKPDMSPSPTGKGYGLRKWRRIMRVGKMMTRQLVNSDVSSSKRMQYDERREKSEGSVSSTNALVQTFDGLGLGLGPPLAAGADSENSEDRSSKSSTEATAPKIKYEMPVVSGFPHDKSMMRNLSGKKLTQQGKGRVETRNKARGEWVKIEKESSHSSLESDSRSSNFLFMQGTYSANDETRNERLTDYDGENNEFAGGCEQEVTDGHRSVYGGHDEGEYEGLSPEGGVADSSSEVKEERSENHGSSSDQDPLHEFLSVLQSVQEAIEKEVSKFQEIGKTFSADSSVSDLGTEIIDDEVVETGDIDLETEVEDLLKQKIEAEVEHMVISRMVQELRAAAAAVDQITVLEEQKALASEQTHILNKLGVAERKAAALEKKAEKLENIDEDIASADEVMKLQSKVCKYGSCFVMQLILLLVVLGVFIFHLSPSDIEVVPT